VVTQPRFVVQVPEDAQLTLGTLPQTPRDCLVGCDSYA
jgi:hypothetical protein